LPFTKALSIVFLAQLTLWLGFWITPLTNERLSEELFKNLGGLSKVPPRTPVTVRPPTITQFGTPPGAPHKDPEGKLGKPLTKKEAPEPPKGAPIVDTQKRLRDQQKIASAAMIRALSGVGSAFKSLLEGGGLDKKVNDAFGGLTGGHTTVDFHGMGGTGSRGFGPGGGGNGAGIGPLPTKGEGSGPGGYGTMGFGGMVKKETKVTSGPSVVQGALSKDLIGNVIKKHWSEIKYCYETELNKDPQLNGKVSMSFTIDSTGAVSQADVAETTMNNRNVESCIVNRVRRWMFPEPRGGGEVIVTYPWIFRAAGADAE
jgi:outer membrane biosynthesis protein TonB